MSLRVYYEVLNQRGTPALFTDTFANRPAFGFQGRLFISTDTAQIFEDTGSAWTLLADATGSVSGFVPYTGATGSVNIGVYGLKASLITTEGGYNFKILPSGTLFENGYSVLSSVTGSVSITQAISAGNLKAFTFDFSAWATNTARTYTLPDASGTLALTSNLSSYLPLTGGTLTGALNFTGGTNINLGTTDNFALFLRANNLNILTLFPTGNAGINAGGSDTGEQLQVTGTSRLNGNVFAPQIRALTSAGLSINANSGTQVADFGAGGSANLTLYGGLSGTSASFSSSVTGNTIVKSGGTAAQILAADGSVITAGTNITISGGTISSSGGGGMAIGGSITSATSGSILFAGASGVLAQNNAQFFWDITNTRLGLGTITLGSKFQINGNAAIGYSASTTAPNNGLLVNGNVGVGTTTPSFSNSGVGINVETASPDAAYLKVSYSGGNSAEFRSGLAIAGIGNVSNNPFQFITNNTERARFTSGGDFGIGTTTIGSKMQVNGNAAIGYSASTAAPTNGMSVAGTVNVGTNTSVTTAALQVSSTTQGFLPPVMTTTQKNAITSPATGLVVFDSTLGKLCVFSTTWQTITSI